MQYNTVEYSGMGQHQRMRRYKLSVIQYSNLPHLTGLLKFVCVCVCVRLCAWCVSVSIAIQSVFLKGTPIELDLSPSPLCPPGHLPVSCQDVQRVHGRVPDGEHLLRIHGKALKVTLEDILT